MPVYYGDMNSDANMREFFATCGLGLEQVLADELRGLGAARVRPLQNGVAFFGSLEDGLRACLWLRTASRVLLIVDRVAARDADELYASIRAIPWEQHIALSGTFALDVKGSNDALRNTQFVAMRAKDAIVDRLRDTAGDRPNVRRERPDVLVNLRLRKDKATVAIDLSGEPLHRRGYRVPSGAITAPLRETLAAAMVLSATSLCRADQVGQADFVFDPFCGSGTIAIEAALLAADRAPGLLRDYWGFSGWLGHDEDAWYALLDEADERFDKGLARCSNGRTPPVYANDLESAAVRVAVESARKAGVDKLIEFSTSGIGRLTLPDSWRGKQGCLITNPPYGERLSDAEHLPALYAALSGTLQRHDDWFAASIITPDDTLEGYLDPIFDAEPIKRIATMNGPLKAAIRLWSGC